MSKAPPTITSNQCPFCRGEFASLQAVRGHLHACKARAAGKPATPADPPFVAAVKPTPAAPAPQNMPPPPPAMPPAVPVFVAAVDAPPPPPPPPAAADTTQYVPQMPLPQAAGATAGTPLSEWTPPKAATQLPELHPEPTVTVATAEGQPTPVQAQPAAAPGTALAPVKSAVDIVKVLQVLSKRVFTWEGPGPLTDEECEMLRQVITWQPGPAAGATVVLSAVFLPRLLTFPPLADRLGKLFVAGLDRLIDELGGSDDDKPAPAAPPPKRAEPSPPAARDASPAAPVAAVPTKREDLVRDAWAAAGVNDNDDKVAA